jgi:hypothetical protein
MKIGDTARGRVSPGSPLSLILCPRVPWQRAAVTRPGEAQHLAVLQPLFASGDGPLAGH